MNNRWQNELRRDGPQNETLRVDWVSERRSGGGGKGGGGWGLGLFGAAATAYWAEGGLLGKILIPITISNVFENTCSVVYLVFSSAHVFFDLLAMHHSQIPVRFIVTKNPRKSFVHGDM